jgi:hypothetical protein
MEEISANIINECITSQVNAAGKHYTIFRDIIDHRSNKRAVLPNDGYTLDRRGNYHRRITT